MEEYYGDIFESYDEETQELIIRLGCYMYKEYFSHFSQSSKDSYESYNKDTKMKEYIKTIDELNDKLTKQRNETEYIKRRREKLSEEIDTIRITLNEQYNKETEFYKSQIVILQNEKNQLLSLFKETVNEKVDEQTKHLKEQLREAQKKNEYYHNLYVDKSKGKYYENELYPALMNYNDKKLGSMWRITHVGSKHKEKCDFHFRHKDTGAIILLDTKNNNEHKPVPVTDMEKFLRDVNNEENNAIGGILLANGKISNKRLFEVNQVNGHTLVFISSFEFGNVEFIFGMLDMILEKQREKEETINIEQIKKEYRDNYKFLQERLISLNTEKRKIENKINEIRNTYNILFKDDIELNEKENVIQLGGEKNRNETSTTSTNIIDYMELEKEKKIIGKRSKYYLCYENEGEKVLQYFPSNYKLKQKKEKLEKKNNSGEKNMKMDNYLKIDMSKK